MNYITNDRGERVLAEGAPGSIARVSGIYTAAKPRCNKCEKEASRD